MAEKRHRRWIEASPAARIPEPGVEQSRDRVLSDDELRELWAKLQGIRLASETDEESEPAVESTHGPPKRRPRVTVATAEAFQVQLLTGQRPGEVRSMRWADVNLGEGRWTIPAASSKNGRPHRVPLVRQVLDILKARREAAEDEAKFVFETSSGRRIDCAPRQEGGGDPLPVVEFHFPRARLETHRGYADGGSRCHPRAHRACAEPCAGGTIRNVRLRPLHYDAEKRAALERWSNRLTTIIEKKPAKIIPIAR